FRHTFSAVHMQVAAASQLYETRGEHLDLTHSTHSTPRTHVHTQTCTRKHTHTHTHTSLNSFSLSLIHTTYFLDTHFHSVYLFIGQINTLNIACIETATVHLHTERLH